MIKQKSIYCYTNPLGYGKTYYEFNKLQRQNKKLFEENKKLKTKIEMLEIINFRLITKEYFNEKS